MRKTKIVCTIGPATDDDSVMRQVMLSGMNVARFNFSHGDHATHEKRFEQISRLREELGLPIATLMDTRGPEIRLGKFVDDKPVTIETGDTYTLTTDDVLCDDKVGSISFKNLPRDVKPGVHILVNDGVIEMVVEKVTVTTIVCHVIHGGVLSNNKGINVPCPASFAALKSVSPYSPPGGRNSCARTPQASSTAFAQPVRSRSAVP